MAGNENAILFVIFLTFTAALPERSFGTAIEQICRLKGAAYRQAIVSFTDAESHESILERILQEKDDDDLAWHVRIMLARIRKPDVFAELEGELAAWRDGQRDGFSQGQLSNKLFLFTRRGPECRFVSETDDQTSLTTNFTHGTTIFMQPRSRKVERFSRAEVAAGIERNNAARLAILEHFLKFMDDDTPYEQSEIVLLVARLWGRGWNIGKARTVATAPSPNMGCLMSQVFDDPSRPFEARFWAADNLAEARPLDVCSFMLATVTNIACNAGYQGKEYLLDRALFHLYWLADDDDRVVLLSQTNCPAWMVEQIRVTAESIGKRLNAPFVDSRQ